MTGTCAINGNDEMQRRTNLTEEIAMKRVIVTAAGVLVLAAGSAYAGCDDGSHAAADQSQTPVVADADSTNPELLAKLKEQEETEALEKLLEIPAIPN